jgi:hypothetical protein
MLIVINEALTIGLKFGVASLCCSLIGSVLCKNCTFLTLDLISLIYIISNYHIQDFIKENDLI